MVKIIVQDIYNVIIKLNLTIQDTDMKYQIIKINVYQIVQQCLYIITDITFVIQIIVITVTTLHLAQHIVNMV